MESGRDIPLDLGIRRGRSYGSLKHHLAVLYHLCLFKLRQYLHRVFLASRGMIPSSAPLT